MKEKNDKVEVITDLKEGDPLLKEGENIKITSCLNNCIEKSQLNLYSFLTFITLCLISSHIGYYGLINYFMIPEFEKMMHISSFQKSLLGGSLNIGYLIGSIIVGPIADTYGRKICIVYSSILCFIFGTGWFIPNLHFLVAYNIILGICYSIYYNAACTLVSEIVNNKTRALMLSFPYILQPTFHLISIYVAQYFRVFDPHESGWKVLIALRGIFVFE